MKYLLLSLLGILINATACLQFIEAPLVETSKSEPESDKVAAIKMGWGATCALTTKGAMSCWKNREDAYPEALRSDLAARKWVQISTTDNFNSTDFCALGSDGKVACFQRGDMPTIDVVPNPASRSELLSSLNPINQVSFQYDFLCALQVGGELKCFYREGYPDKTALPAVFPTAMEVIFSARDGLICGLSKAKEFHCIDGDKITKVDNPSAIENMYRLDGASRCALLSDKKTVSCWKPLKNLPAFNPDSQPSLTDLVLDKNENLCGLNAERLLSCFNTQEWPKKMSNEDLSKHKFSSIIGVGSIACGTLTNNKVLCWTLIPLNQYPDAIPEHLRVQ